MSPFGISCSAEDAERTKGENVTASSNVAATSGRTHAARLADKSLLDAAHEVLEMRFSDFVVDFSAVAMTCKKTTPLHQSQMFGSHVVRDTTIRGEFSDGIAAVQQQLHDSEPHWMGKRSEALGCPFKRFDISSRGIWQRLSFFDAHSGTPGINIS
jgi:hypothetical protein